MFLSDETGNKINNPIWNERLNPKILFDSSYWWSFL